jgi:hypothetical protein
MPQEVKQSYLNKARKDKFLLVFDVPPALKRIVSQHVRNNTNISPDSVQFSIWGTIVPTITVKANETRHAGQTLYVSSHSRDSYPPVNVKFNVDSMYSNYWTLYKWLNLLNDQKTGIYNQSNTIIDGNHQDYQTDLTIYALDENDRKRVKFVYTKAFPTSVDQLEFTEQATGEMEIGSGFTFVYSQLLVELIADNVFQTTLD